MGQLHLSEQTSVANRVTVSGPVADASVLIANERSCDGPVRKYCSCLPALCEDHSPMPTQLAASVRVAFQHVPRRMPDCIVASRSARRSRRTRKSGVGRREIGMEPTLRFPWGLRPVRSGPLLSPVWERLALEQAGMIGTNHSEHQQKCSTRRSWSRGNDHVCRCADGGRHAFTRDDSGQHGGGRSSDLGATRAGLHLRQ